MKTTKEQFQYFVKECKKRIKEYGLGGWKVYFQHQDLANDFARISANLTVMVATIFFCDDWDDPIRPCNNAEIAVVARHEVLHLLTSRIMVNAKTGYVSENELDEAGEELVRKLESIFYSKKEN